MRTDRSWIDDCLSMKNGVIEFLNSSFSKAVLGGQIRCPCKRCKNRYWLKRSEVFDYLKAFGFVENYDMLVFHGEETMSVESITETQDGWSCFHDNTDELLNDRFRNAFEGPARVQKGPTDDAKKFFKLLDDDKKRGVPGM